MKVRASHRYSQPVDVVFELFCQPDFYVRKFESVGGRNVEVLESERSGDGFSISVRRDMPAAAPAVIRSIIGEWTTLVQAEEWGGDPGEEYWNEIDVDADMVPVKITGTMNLRARDDGCVNEVELDIRCGIPLLGRKVEEFVAGDAEKTLAAEHDFIRSELAG